MLSSTSAASDTVIPDTSDRSLSPYSFAGLVEQRLLEKFDRDDIERVLESWRLADMDYEHREVIRENCSQQAHSYVRGLHAQPFWNVDDHEWCQKLESKYKEIYKEFSQQVLTPTQRKNNNNNNNNKDDLVWSGALTEEATSYGVGWKTLVLMNRGMWDAEHVRRFPVTAKAVRDAGVPVTEVFFASMEADSTIQPHSDFTNFVLTSHLAVEIPYSGTNQCRLTVGDETRQWQNGNVMLFDTSILHDAVNESDQRRYILMMRVWHPDLTSTEREGLQFIYDCLEFPDLVHDDPAQRQKAEEQVQAMRTFPKFVARGFGAAGGKKKKPKKKKR